MTTTSTSTGPPAAAGESTETPVRQGNRPSRLEPGHHAGPPAVAMLHEQEAAANDTFAGPVPGDVPLDGLDVGSLLASIEAKLDAGPEHLPTGWPRIDAALGGGLLVPSLNVIGAGPKSFKSTWAQIVAVRHAEAGGVAYVLDLENGKKRFARRLLCRKAEIGAREVAAALADHRRGVFTSQAVVHRWRETKEWLRQKLKGRLYAEFTPPHDLVARVAEARRVAGDRQLLIVIDSLQKLPQDFTDRRSSIDKWILLLARLRDEFEVTILAVSEIRRGRDGYSPREDAFKESGSIEYSADFAATMDRASADGATDGDEVVTLRVQLAREGDEDPRGDIASYTPARPFYGLIETDPVAIRRSRGKRGPGPAPVERADAEALLRRMLVDGPEQARKLVKAAGDEGISRATVYRAKQRLGLVECTVRRDKGWRLP